MINFIYLLAKQSSSFQQQVELADLLKSFPTWIMTLKYIFLNVKDQ